MRSWSARPLSARLFIVLTAVLAVLSALLVAPRAAHADTTSTGDPAYDRTNVARVWQTAGPMVRAVAEQALLGGDADIEKFVATGWQDAQRLDDQAAVQRLMMQGGDTERTAAAAALSSTDPQAVTTFLAGGWRTPWETDLRLRINQMMATGGSSLKTAAQAALDSDDVDQYNAFLDTGWETAWTTDQRLKVNQIMAKGGPNVQSAAQAALDAGNVDAYTDFIGSGWALATARDQEQATIADLTGSAVASANEAVRQSDQAKEAGAKAAAAAAAAKAAAKTAADLAASAHGNAKLAAAAAGQAADAANSAASAASEAIGAANAAGDAARSAAAAASRAANAATRAANSAADAYKAAGAAAAKAGTAKTASDAAKKARDTATDAKTAANAAVTAGNAANTAAQQAVAASNGAAVDAKHAADAADAAASASGDASAEARRAHAAAARARANADRSQRAATAAANFAHAAATAAATSAAAANRAADDANKAATAADLAAANAGTAAKDAKLATQHAASASAAAADAVTAVTAATDVYNAARQADNDRIALIGEQADEAAVTAKQQVDDLNAQTGADAEAASTRSAETNRLITEGSAASTDPATALLDARKVAITLSDPDAGAGPWTQAAALAALGGPDDVAIDFLRTQIPMAAAQDDRDRLTAIADPEIGTGSTAMKTAAATALAGSDAQVAGFLSSGDYPGRSTDLRLNLNQVLASAQADNDHTVADRAQSALDDGSVTTMATFLSAGQDAALAIDERIKVNQVLANAPDHTKLKAFAQAALDGPPGLLHQFLTVDQYTASQFDQQSATHDAEMVAMIAHAQQVVAVGVQRANEAQNIAATARGDATAAQQYATAASNSANDAAADATRAKNSAAAAQASADRAAASARQAADAAKRAQASAHDAERSAAWADQSARKAAASATSAQADAKRAHDSAVAAKQSATEAIAAAHEAVDAAKAKIKAENDKAREEVRTACQAYLKAGVPNGQDSYNKCLDMASMNNEQRAALAAKNAASCQTLFPNHSSKAFNNCLQNTLDPAFDTDQAMIVKQMHDAGRNKWWKIGAGILIGGAAIVCILAEPCGAILGAVLEVATPLIAPEFIGVTAATGGGILLAGGAGVAEVRIAGSVESDLVASEVGASRVESSVIDRLSKLPNEGTCLNSFTPNTRVLMEDGSSKAIADVRRGDRVKSTDPRTGFTAGAPVIERHRDVDTALADVTIADGAGKQSVVHTTAEHPFWSLTGAGWAAASTLVAGVVLRGPDGKTDTVTAVRTFAGGRVMRNLTIAGSHTYYVLAGTAAVLVHNACGSLGRDLIPGEDQVHIVFGDVRGGGHKWPGNVGKSVFPESWDTDKILDSVAEVITDPANPWSWQGKPGALYSAKGNPYKVTIEGVVDGVKIRVFFEPATQRVLTAYPPAGQ